MTWSHERELSQRFGENRAMQEALAKYEMDQMMQREQSPHLATRPGVEGNRAERRKQAARARRARP